MIVSLTVLFLVSFSLQALASPEDFVQLCPGVTIDHSISPSFEQGELDWLCGDSESKGYREIPEYQASLHAKAFLQKRGYLDPKFQFENKTLLIRTGKQFRLQEIQEKTTGESEILKSIEARFAGSVMTPGLLNSVQAEVARELKLEGYPCPEVEVESLGEVVRVSIRRGKQVNFESLEILYPTSLHEAAFLRFQPFKMDQVYDVSKIDLYEKRLLRENIVHATNVRNICRGAKPLLEQSFMLGPPKTVRFGVGIDTERGPFVNFSWDNHRFKQMASKLSLDAQVSKPDQAINTLTEYYLWTQHPRLAVQPEARLQRKSRDDFREIKSQLDLGLFRSWDLQNHFIRMGAGPSLTANWFGDDSSGGQLKNDKAIELFVSVDHMSHGYEVSDIVADQGLWNKLNFVHRGKAMGADYTTTRMELNSVWVDPLKLSGSKKFYGALRWGGAISRSDAPSLDLLPPSSKTYLGGFSNLRGFELDELPENSGLGALTSIYFGGEIRGSRLILDTLFPYIFFDAGKYGLSSMTFDSNLFWSTGFGLRWLSPLGLVQGYVSTTSTRNVYFHAGLGGQF
ncbi:BamA/TamA family outer membrane protein [bacterium]|nr:BamA/TamA family outer membrane protein [bacterium]